MPWAVYYTNNGKLFQVLDAPMTERQEDLAQVEVATVKAKQWSKASKSFGTRQTLLSTQLLKTHRMFLSADDLNGATFECERCGDTIIFPKTGTGPTVIGGVLPDDAYKYIDDCPMKDYA